MRAQSIKEIMSVEGNWPYSLSFLIFRKNFKNSINSPLYRQGNSSTDRLGEIIRISLSLVVMPT